MILWDVRLALITWYWPARHAYTFVPSGQYVPALQTVHALDSGYDPGLHGLQLVDDVAPVVAEYRPAAHDVQAVLPVPAAYWPAKHTAQLDAEDGANCPDEHA